MTATVLSASIQGIEAQKIFVEFDVQRGLPSFAVIGLPDAIAQESRERVRAVIKNCGFEFPIGRLTMNLAPADMRKIGSALDIPMALAILNATGQCPAVPFPSLAIGEMTLNGEARPVRGAIAFALLARAIGHVLILPKASAIEAAMVRGVRVIPVDKFSDLVEQLRQDRARPTEIVVPTRRTTARWNTWPNIRGQESAKRIAVIAAAGGHNMLMVGPPGTGKTMIAEGLLELLPPLADEAQLEVLNIVSLAGSPIRGESVTGNAPFRNPHHTASVAAFTGGGRNPRPGELTLAHRGVLFLDELAEFRREHIEALRQPIELGRAIVNRVAGTVQYPADFMLVAAMNPCPCGFYNDPDEPCRCTMAVVRKYIQKISGPILDRFDLATTLRRVRSPEIRTRSLFDPRPIVSQVRQLSQKQFGCLNGRIQPRQLHELAIERAARKLLETAVDRLRLSMRAHDRLLRVALTVSQIDAQSIIQPRHIAEALQYRPPALLGLTSRMPRG